MNLNNRLKANNKKFLKNMVESASPIQLIIILYEGALQWMQMAKAEIKKNKDTNLPNWSNFSNYMTKTHGILTHLQESLDHSQAEQLADRLHSLYDFMKTELGKANAHKDEKRIDEVIELLKDLKVTWKEALSKEKIADKTA